MSERTEELREPGDAGLRCADGCLNAMLMVLAGAFGLFVLTTLVGVIVFLLVGIALMLEMVGI